MICFTTVCFFLTRIIRTAAIRHVRIVVRAYGWVSIPDFESHSTYSQVHFEDFPANLADEDRHQFELNRRKLCDAASARRRFGGGSEATPTQHPSRNRCATILLAGVNSDNVGTLFRMVQAESSGADFYAKATRTLWIQVAALSLTDIVWIAAVVALEPQLGGIGAGTPIIPLSLMVSVLSVEVRPNTPLVDQAA